MYFCIFHENNLAYMSRNKFTHFIRKVFARQSLPTGMLRLFRARDCVYISSYKLHDTVILKDCSHKKSLRHLERRES